MVRFLRLRLRRFPSAISQPKSLLQATLSSWRVSPPIIVFQVDKETGALRQTDSIAAGTPDVVVDSAAGIIHSTANGETTSYRLVKGSLKTIGSSPATIQN